MSWWKKLWPKSASPTPSDLIHQVSLSMPGWNEEAPAEEMRTWRDPHDAVLSLAFVESRSWLDELIQNEYELREWARDLATSREAGVIEASATSHNAIKAMYVIYKRLVEPAYIYAGSS